MRRQEEHRISCYDNSQNFFPQFGLCFSEVFKLTVSFDDNNNPVPVLAQLKSRGAGGMPEVHRSCTASSAVRCHSVPRAIPAPCEADHTANLG